ncbi:MFS transporter [Micromonospora sp. MED01]|nr:MFS transporter [Micromonospora alfalfae]MCG5466619.1 MFS transporter [Micromonospora alfalfae]
MVNQLGINLGFYMLMPYLANHLSSGLGMAAWTVGLVLGVRTLSQQGMFLVGGILADRLGYKTMIVAGCGLRTIGFALLGVVSDLPMLLAAAVATGLAGALFNPAVRAYVAAEAGQRRVEAFAMFNVFYQAGILIGPVVGLALISLNFRVVCLSAAMIFLLLTVVQMRALPARSAPPQPGRRAGLGGVRTDWRQVVSNRSFLLFSMAMIGSYVLSSQIYLALPLQATRVLGRGGDVGSSALFALSAVVAVIGQLRLTAWARRRWNSGKAIAVGLALMTAAFLPLAATAGVRAQDGSLAMAAVAIVPTLIATLLLTLGTVVAYPFEMDTIVALARDRLVATHYGLYNTFAGIGITVGNLATGAAWGLAQRWEIPALPWLVLIATGAACATAVAGMARSRRLEPGSQAAVNPTSAAVPEGAVSR